MQNFRAEASEMPNFGRMVSVLLGKIKKKHSFDGKIQTHSKTTAVQQNVTVAFFWLESQGCFNKKHESYREQLGKCKRTHRKDSAIKCHYVPFIYTQLGFLH